MAAPNTSAVEPELSRLETTIERQYNAFLSRISPLFQNDPELEDNGENSANSHPCVESTKEQESSHLDDNRIGSMFEKGSEHEDSGESSVSSDSCDESIEEQNGSDLENNNDEGSIIVISARHVELVEEQNESEIEDNNEGSTIHDYCRDPLELYGESPSRSDLFGESEHRPRYSRKRVILGRISLLLFVFFVTLLCWTIIDRNGNIHVVNAVVFYFFSALVPGLFLSNEWSSKPIKCKEFSIFFWSMVNIACSFVIIWAVHLETPYGETPDLAGIFQIAISSIALFSAIYHPILCLYFKKMDKAEEEDPFEFNEVPV